MSAQPGNTMSDAWANLEGHVVNGVFPLLRYLGSSSHSGVFLTRSANHEPPDVALKLVPSVRRSRIFSCRVGRQPSISLTLT
ncbi:MAG: hypothetical protein WDO56_20495 [Gammaproteobacteria bacterium]